MGHAGEWVWARGQTVSWGKQACLAPQIREVVERWQKYELMIWNVKQFQVIGMRSRIWPWEQAGG